MFRLTIRDVLWLTVVVAMGVGFFVTRESARYQLRPDPITKKWILVDTTSGLAWEQNREDGSWRLLPGPQGISQPISAPADEN